MLSRRLPLLACQIRFRQDPASPRIVVTPTTTKKTKPT